ncbi:hypothetical protein PV328_007866 [Microctonus aethiopoides]|uniref:Mutator-like transposase domain-containing protein n=1 Tax=Microctonus aethiopoides TaxID=144406 RepID=A0AA39EZ91_9HYME|nr:hypothetical protein PV328_007866 [Microctonus aethiopoides]
MDGKILDYAERIRKCKFCDLGRKKDDHDSRKNFEGSAKATETSAGADLINNSSILKEANLEARVLIGDEDSCTIAAVRRGNPKKIFKIVDLNHLKKIFNRDLWKMANFKEIKKSSIDHIKKCFSYAFEPMLKISGSGKQTVLLTNLVLFDKLSAISDKYAASANKFSIPASIQANESFNNIMAYKSPKNICYSRSESSRYCLASSKYRMLSERNVRALDAKQPAAKKRRIFATQERKKLR